MIDEPLDGRLFGPDHHCFGCEPTHPFGFHLTFTREDDSVVTRFTPGHDYQGPLNVMHGGLVMTLADELSAWALLALLGKFGFTVDVSCKLRRPVRIGVEMVGRARIAKNSGRIVRVAFDVSQTGESCMAGEMAFAILDMAAAENLMGQPLPKSWARFCR